MKTLFVLCFVFAASMMSVISEARMLVPAYRNPKKAFDQMEKLEREVYGRIGAHRPRVLTHTVAIKRILRLQAELKKKGKRFRYVSTEHTDFRAAFQRLQGRMNELQDARSEEGEPSEVFKDSHLIHVAKAERRVLRAADEVDQILDDTRVQSRHNDPHSFKLVRDLRKVDETIVEARSDLLDEWKVLKKKLKKDPESAILLAQRERIIADLDRTYE